MSIKLLLITHSGIAESLINISSQILGHDIEGMSLLAIANDSNCEQSKKQADTAAQALDNNDGLLILTDIYGATPSNIAMHLLEQPNRRLVAGVNLPMILKAITYRHLSLDALTKKVINGGQGSIIQGQYKTEAGANSA